MTTTSPNANTSLGTTTPIRAIRSTFANRSIPSIPPATHLYEPIVKSLFRHRLKFVLLYSVLATWAIESSWAVWHSGGVQSVGIIATVSYPFSPWVIFFSLITWATVALPVIVIRKVFLTAQRSSATSPLQTFKNAVTQSNSRVAILTYLCSAVCALFMHVAMSYTYEYVARGDPKLSIYVKSKKHPHYLNGRLVFLIFSQFSAAALMSMYGALTDRFVYRWVYSLMTPLVPITLIFVPLISALITTMSFVLTLFLFTLARSFLPVLFKIPVLSLFLRPFVAHFLRGWTIFLPLRHYPLIIRAWFLSFTTFLNWEAANSLFEHLVPVVTSVSALSTDSNTTLVSGITSDDKIFKFFAFSELKDIAMDTSAPSRARRTAIYGDPKSVPNLWTVLVREALLLLGRDYQLYLNRGKPAPPRAAPPPPTPKDISNPPFTTPTRLLRQRVFKATSDSPVSAALNALASDGPIAKAVEVGADAAHVPELFRSVETKVLSTPIVGEAKKNVEAAKSYGAHLKSQIGTYFDTFWTKFVPELLRVWSAWFKDWLVEERRSRIVETSLPFRELDVVVVDVLSYLTCQSLVEDRYGIVQRDIPRILEAMVSFLLAIEEWRVQINADITSSSGNQQVRREETNEELQKIHAILGFMEDGLKEGIGRIVKTFGEKLTAFKFPPRIARKLQEFLDYT